MSRRRQRRSGCGGLRDSLRLRGHIRSAGGAFGWERCGRGGGQAGAQPAAPTLCSCFCRHCHRRGCIQLVVHSSHDSLVPPQASEQREQLALAKRKLEEVVRGRFSAAAAAADHAVALRFVRLYPQLGLQQEGLQAFCSYLRSTVAQRARAEYEALADSLRSNAPPLPGAPTFVSTLTNLFKDIAEAVEENEPLLAAGDFGAGAVVRAASELHAECDGRGAQILRRFMEHRQVLQTRANPSQTLETCFKPALTAA